MNYAIRTLIPGKTAGDDNIASEHIMFAHPSLVLHLKRIFNIILSHGHVTSKFGSCISVPLLKDKFTDVGNIDNFWGNTLCNVIYKVFEKKPK